MELTYLGKPAEAWIPQLKDKEPAVRRKAAEALANLGRGPGGKAAGPGETVAEPTWEKGIRTERVVPFPRPAAAALARALRDEDTDVRVWAANGLARFSPAKDISRTNGKPDGKIVSGVKCFLAMAGFYLDNYEIYGALEDQSELEPADREIVLALARALDDRVLRVRHSAARALRHIGRSADLAVPALVRAVADEDADVRAAAREALDGMGKAGRAALDRLPEPRIVTRLRPAGEEPVGLNRPLRAAALRWPYVYVMDREGTLYVFRVPAEHTRKAVHPVRTIKDAGDGLDVKVFGDRLLCTGRRGLEVYSLKDPEAPCHLGRFGPELGRAVTIVRAEPLAFVLSDRGVCAFDLRGDGAPRFLDRTPCAGWPWTGCVAGPYLYVGLVEEDPGDRKGIAVFDRSDPRALREVGFVRMEDSPYDLFAGPDSRLVASLDGNRWDLGWGTNGHAQLFSLANPRQPAPLDRVSRAGGRATVLTAGHRPFLLCAGDAWRLDERGLSRRTPLDAGGGLTDGLPYHGDCTGDVAVLAVGNAAVVVRLPGKE